MVRDAMALEAPRTELVELDYLDSHPVFDDSERGGRFVTQQPSGGLEGYAALVTGGGTGIGKACAARLAADGAAVTICGRTESRLVDAAKVIGAESRDGWPTTAGACSTSPPTSPTRTA